MLVNLSQSFIPLQKIWQKGVDRPVEILMKGAGNILMTGMLTYDGERAE